MVRHLEMNDRQLLYAYESSCYGLTSLLAEENVRNGLMKSFNLQM
jgi:hypothetical protein